MTFEERKKQVKSYLGKIVRIKMDRPIGTEHPKHPGLLYPINYGYIPGVYGGDGEELDVYLLGVDIPVVEYTARIIGIIHRHNDVEDKLIAAPDGMTFTAEEMKNAVHFQEEYYISEIEPLQ
jgi:inorganic pyrophosphatase